MRSHASRGERFYEADLHRVEGDLLLERDRHAFEQAVPLGHQGQEDEVHHLTLAEEALPQGAAQAVHAGAQLLDALLELGRVSHGVPG